MSEARDFRLNRVFSNRLTALFIKLPLTPNHITSLSLVSGILAGFFLSNGEYAAAVAGALFYQLSCVLDNCDGEVARAKNMRSKFGEWYDITADFVVDLALFTGMAAHMSRTDEGPARVLWALCVIGGALHLGLVIFEKLKGFGPAVYEAPNARDAASDNFVLRFLDSVREGDASWIVIVFALIGQIPLLLWCVAVYMQILWISSVVMNRRFFARP